MHWKHYLGYLENFLIYKGFIMIFPKSLEANLTYYESENFSDSFLHHIFESENLVIFFCKKNSLTWAVNGKNSTSENPKEFVR